MQFTRRQQEALDLLQEECGEVVQQISKVRRFGPDFRCHGGKDDTCIDLLKKEVYDVIFFMHFLESTGVLDLSKHEYAQHCAGKVERLKKWSNLYANH